MKLRRTQKRRRVKRRSQRRQKGRGGLIVKYGDITLSGQELKKATTVSAPSIEFPSTDKKYTLVMWDPDVPPQIQPGFVHWLVTNLQSPTDIQNNQVLDYKGPAPPSGVHRYYFGLFEQRGTISPKQPDRPNFSINEFVKDNNLIKTYEVFMKVSAN
jgi:phosphatidylethanolamine-binding protein (PEBP) family uncharacterized protein